MWGFSFPYTPYSVLCTKTFQLVQLYTDFENKSKIIVANAKANIYYWSTRQVEGSYMEKDSEINLLLITGILIVFGSYFTYLFIDQFIGILTAVFGFILIVFGLLISSYED